MIVGDVCFENPLCHEALEEFNSIDIDKEISDLLNAKLITPPQALEIKMRHILLNKLLSIVPPLNVTHICWCFFDRDSPSDITNHCS